ncbi:tRNA N(3)-methylcytidine methyltransferase METTL6 [Aethina tumida]|uniref:tRNA N(3)-methylcytidine methyltransferase METTL6 n=1 Tax=Aethina tumida TaxID=116153 RepID=UPI0021478958|nr:tRNA N(3)-methylcytidine methyltransferase METTL6 [Aethina tumida]XP_049821361.1 tRNA N(3)-methylcytidine methyltransferase METTL6 [Aethina tumida]
MENVATSTTTPKVLTDEDRERLKSQDQRLVSDHKAQMLELQAKKHWDLFYKRNETRFFKDRHWTTREFCELLDGNMDQRRTIFEIGCGVGNFIFPLIEENLNIFALVCDLSPRAIEMVKSNTLYNEETIRAFQGDITSDEILTQVEPESVDIATLIFVLSAIHPNKFVKTLKTIHTFLKDGGIVLFRDYGLYDMAQLRFKAGHKISENFYMRQDGTRSYYFSVEFVKTIFEEAGFVVVDNSYIHRRTINKKENIDVPRIFVQTKAKKICK